MAEIPALSDASFTSDSDSMHTLPNPHSPKRPRAEEPSVEQAAAAMQALVRAPAPAPSIATLPESPRKQDEERNRERNRGYARAYRERKRLKLQTLESFRQELLKENSRLLEEAQARERREAATSAERDAARDRLARVEAENRALRAWIHQLNAPSRAQAVMKHPMLGLGAPAAPRRAVLVPRE